MLSFNNFFKAYDSDLILQIPDLTISPGIHWIKGQNGSGKTTLFKVLAGLLSYKGQITLAPAILLSKETILHRKYINYGEAEPLYPDFLTGMDLIQLFAKAKQAPFSQVQDLIETFQAGSFLNKPVNTYSSGMQKKLSLILAFTGKPKIILLDEPLITLDEQTVRIMYKLILEYHQNHGVSFLISSHQDISMPELPFTATWLVHNRLFTQSQ